MATAINSGVMSAEGVSTEGRRIIDMSSKIYMLESEAAPLCSFLMSPNFPKGVAKSPKVEWLSSTLLPRVTVCTEALDDSETGVDVATGTGAYFRPGDIILNTFTLERMKVTSVATDTLTVKRGFGTASYGTTGTASAGAVDQIMRVANAQAEGSTLGTIKQVAYVANYNYTQITRTAGGFTRTTTQTDLYGGNEPAVEAKRKAVEHKVELESNLFWGARQIDTTGSQPLRGMGGLSYYISSNITATVGELTETIWTNWLERVGRYGSENKVLFVSPFINAKIASFVRGRLAIDDTGAGVKQYGLALNSYLTPRGKKFGIVVKQDWSDFSLTASTYSPAGLAFAVDMSDIQLAVMQPTRYADKQEANDEDSKKFDYLTEQSLRVGNEQNHGILAGVTS